MEYPIKISKDHKKRQKSTPPSSGKFPEEGGVPLANKKIYVSLNAER